MSILYMLSSEGLIYAADTEKERIKTYIKKNVKLNVIFDSNVFVNYENSRPSKKDSEKYELASDDYQNFKDISNSLHLYAVSNKTITPKFYFHNLFLETFVTFNKNGVMQFKEETSEETKNILKDFVSLWHKNDFDVVENVLESIDARGQTLKLYIVCILKILILDKNSGIKGSDFEKNTELLFNFMNLTLGVFSPIMLYFGILEFGKHTSSILKRVYNKGKSSEQLKTKIIQKTLNVAYDLDVLYSSVHKTMEHDKSIIFTSDQGLMKLFSILHNSKRVYGGVGIAKESLFDAIKSQTKSPEKLINKISCSLELRENRHYSKPKTLADHISFMNNLDELFNILLQEYCDLIL